MPHGGGAVPYHWGRFRGLADMLGRPPIHEWMPDHVFSDTCVYHQPGINLFTGSIMFGSEMIGTVRDIDPQTGHHFDDTRRYVHAVGLRPDIQAQVYELNARRV